jgi:hypothetical protein
MQTKEEIAGHAVSEGDQYAKNGDITGAIDRHTDALEINPACWRARLSLQNLLTSYKDDKEQISEVIIKKFPEEKSLKLIAQCKDRRTLLGQYFWRNRIWFTDCDLGKGQLRELMHHSLLIFNKFNAKRIEPIQDNLKLVIGPTLFPRSWLFSPTNSRATNLPCQSLYVRFLITRKGKNSICSRIMALLFSTRNRKIALFSRG